MDADQYGAVADLNWHIHTVTYDGTNVTWWVDGTVIQNFPFAVSLATAASPLFMNSVAEDAEIIVYDTVLTATERQTLNATLEGKYALFRGASALGAVRARRGCRRSYLAAGGAEAVVNVVVDETARLHEGVANGGADEAETALLQVLAHGVRLGRACRS